MKKLLLLAVLTLSMSAMANTEGDADASEVEAPTPETVVVRTGTCGSIAASTEKNCKSVGINVKTGEIVMSVDADGKDVWTEGSAVVVGQLATQGALDVVKADVAVNKVGVVNNAGDIDIVNKSSIERDNALGQRIDNHDALITDIDQSVASNSVLAYQAAGMARTAHIIALDVNDDSIQRDEAAGERIDTNAAAIATAVANYVSRDAVLFEGQYANTVKISKNSQGIASNTNLIADVEQSSKDRDALLSKQLTDEEAARIAGDLASVERDIIISADVAVNKAGVATNAAGIASTNAELSTVSGKVDANKFAHDNLEVRVKQADVRLVETDVRVYANAQGISANSSSIDGLRDYSRDNRVAIAGNSSRIDWNSVSIGNLQHDINRLDGQIAAQVAASASIMPSNWDGRFAVTVGVGSYRGQTGLALGIMHDNGDWAVKAQVTGTDADNWSDLAVGASVGFAF